MPSGTSRSSGACRRVGGRGRYRSRHGQTVITTTCPSPLPSLFLVIFDRLSSMLCGCRKHLTSMKLSSIISMLLVSCCSACRAQSTSGHSNILRSSTRIKRVNGLYATWMAYGNGVCLLPMALQQEKMGWATGSVRRMGHRVPRSSQEQGCHCYDREFFSEELKGASFHEYAS